MLPEPSAPDLRASEDPDRLTRRVRWLQHHRRRIALTAGFALAAYVFFAWPRSLDVVSPIATSAFRIQAIFIGVTIGGMLAFAIELVFGTLLAWWELQLARIERARGLPRATLRK